jgi:hypothetical protein
LTVVAWEFLPVVLCYSGSTAWQGSTAKHLDSWLSCSSKVAVQVDKLQLHLEYLLPAVVHIYGMCRGALGKFWIIGYPSMGDAAVLCVAIPERLALHSYSVVFTTIYGGCAIVVSPASTRQCKKVCVHNHVLPSKF